MKYLDGVGVGLGPDSRFARLAELGIPAVATDLDGCIRHWSVAAAQLYGRDGDEMLGSSLGAVRLSPEDEAIVPAIIGELLDLGRWQGELEMADASGGPLRLEARATLLVDHGNRPAGFAIALVDLSARSASERLTAESESQARLALADAGEFSQATSGSLVAHIAILDERGTIVAVNAAWSRFADSEGGSSDCVGVNYLAVCAAASDPVGAEVARGLGEIIAGERETMELDYACPSPSEQRWFRMRATRYAGSGPVRVVVMHTDMTERHVAQKQAFLQAALLDQIDVSVIVTDLEQRVTSWNAGAERLYGWTSEEAIGRFPADLLVPKDAGSSSPLIAALRGAGRWSGEYVVAGKDGSSFSAYVRNQVSSDQEGQAAAFVAVSMDISEQKDTERALLRAHNYHRAVTDSMGEGMFTVDAEGTPTYLNPAAKDLLGWPAEALAGSDMHALIHNRSLDGSPLPVEECPILVARRDGKVVRVEDDIFLRPDGSELPVAYTASPFVTEDGIEGCVVVFEDISARKAAAVEIERDLEKLAGVERIQSALQEKRFILCAQPIIALRTGAVEQRELLLRMLPPEDARASGELIAPGSFLPVAEEFGLIVEIDRWVIDRAMAIAAAGLPVQVNVSGRSIGSPGLLDYIEAAIERTGADPGTLVFEITETALISHEMGARAFVEGCIVSAARWRSTISALATEASLISNSFRSTF